MLGKVGLTATPPPRPYPWACTTFPIRGPGPFRAASPPGPGKVAALLTCQGRGCRVSGRVQSACSTLCQQQVRPSLFRCMAPAQLLRQPSPHPPSLLERLERAWARMEASAEISVLSLFLLCPSRRYQDPLSAVHFCT